VLEKELQRYTLFWEKDATDEILKKKNSHEFTDEFLKRNTIDADENVIRRKPPRPNAVQASGECANAPPGRSCSYVICCNSECILPVAYLLMSYYSG